MKDRKPFGSRPGKASHFLEENSAGDANLGLSPDASLAGKEPKQARVAEDLKSGVGNAPVCYLEMDKPRTDLFDKIGVVVDYQAKVLAAKGIVARERGLRCGRGRGLKINWRGCWRDEW
jgi:hypothetical protein